jgi:hypothetical protein
MCEKWTKKTAVADGQQVNVAKQTGSGGGYRSPQIAAKNHHRPNRGVAADRLNDAKLIDSSNLIATFQQ